MHKLLNSILLLLDLKDIHTDHAIGLLTFNILVFSVCLEENL